VVPIAHRPVICDDARPVEGLEVACSLCGLVVGVEWLSTLCADARHNDGCVRCGAMRNKSECNTTYPTMPRDVEVTQRGQAVVAPPEGVCSATAGAAPGQENPRIMRGPNLSDLCGPAAMADQPIGT
jgi:hypothetical protein